MAVALMIQGTASHVGKSVLTAAFGRWLCERGLRVAPFKAQNMSLNSFVTLDGHEIARSQAVQAQALGLEPSADMNPVLLKPMDRGCQVIVQGRPVGIMSIQDYYAYKPHAWEAIATSYQRLRTNYDAVVLEGAGSPAEINLKDHDLVNMQMAREARAAVILVADIERGGVFAQIIGTWELLEPDERERVLGFVINKFRGDASLLESGLRYVHERTRRPVLGVLPYDPSVQVEEEDSLGLSPGVPETGAVDVAVLRLPGISNFTDFSALARCGGVCVRYVAHLADWHRPDLVILPGTRTTALALDWLRATGLGGRVCQAAAEPGGPVILGLCGGFQLLGRTIEDVEGVEAILPRTDALGLLDVDTMFEPRKLLHRVEGDVYTGSLCGGCSVAGYEVHQGVTTRRPGTRPWLRLRRQPGHTAIEDGAISSDGRVCGTYVHGLFDDARFCRALVRQLRHAKCLPPLTDNNWQSQATFWNDRYRELGVWLAKRCDLRPVERALSLDLNFL